MAFVEVLYSECDYSIEELTEEELAYTPDFDSLEEDTVEDVYDYDFLVEDTEDT